MDLQKKEPESQIYEPDYVRKLFDQMSGSYERMNYITSFGFSIRWRKQFLSHLGSSEQPLEVLDLLSGLGENWAFLKKNFPNAHFSTLDFSEQMIQNSTAKAKSLFGDNIDIFCKNVLQSSLPDNHFDIISCAYGLKTFNEEQLQILAKEIYRILKVNGKFSFVEVSKPKNRFLLFFYKFYLSKVIPILGRLFLGNPDDYRMLWVYTQKFSNAESVKAIFEENGLKVSYQSYFAGTASGISGSKSV